MNIYSKTILGVIETNLKEMRRCRESKGMWINDEIYNLCASQVATLLNIIEVIEKIKVESRDDSLENTELRFKIIKELFNV